MVLPRVLTHTQEKRLLRFHAVGDFGGGKWSTMDVLIRLGYVYIDDNGRNLTVSRLGSDYCNAHCHVIGLTKKE